MRPRAAVLLAFLALSVVAAPARAVVLYQEPTPGPCLEGELCLNEDTTTTTGGSSNQGPVSDPAGKWVRSLVAMGVILAVIGVYLSYAFTGGLPFRRKARQT